ncbi:S-adenosyl-L-methionine-dependent methyltransferase [Cantharellus anzutake]|uniref:S-adenosyl-L-methionine-dependent methyltransferase n=1 Tax=Cantharellus anzutake TaxID=1750568 RepID=UPI001904B67C|nr:S-adenosyl-L-methionine-dependent methyltransferase [Cantharellus anzutake]KAF8325228.1 S-adenosyl-L-methionine-dependent methyltransferase [Cantharellus anzutake]
MRRLVARLAAVVGQQNAFEELRWMRQHLQRVSSDRCSSVTFPVLDSIPHFRNSDVLLGQMIQRRLRGEPLQYILGSQPFGSLELVVRPPTLVPRPETEFWALELSNVVKNWTSRPRVGGSDGSIHILDICSGTGCIPLLLMSELSSRIASATALRECHELLVNTSARHTSFAPFTIITCNPPYIPRHEYETIDASVREFEDPTALLGNDPRSKTDDPEGLAFYRRISELLTPSCNAPLLQDSGGILALEVGQGQAKMVRSILQETCIGTFRSFEIWEDQWNVERVVVGYT